MENEDLTINIEDVVFGALSTLISSPLNQYVSWYISNLGL